MWVASTIDQLREHRRALTGSVALVPTMGALHDGHLMLVDIAKQQADHVIVSIFVNPTQFAPNEDLAQYPRDTEGDLARCRQHAVAGVFMPSVQQMYPDDVQPCTVDVPSLTDGLEGASRPGHFQGVLRVVLKLLNLVGPDVAIFGQKDYQQACVVHQMIADLNLSVQLHVAPTVREPDGLAMSSRNRYLDPPQREHATGIYKALCTARTLIEDDGESDPQVVERAMAQVVQAHHMQLDYAVIRHRRTLTPLDCVEPELTGGVVALIAARMGHTRLLDNMIIAAEQPGSQQP